jgi:hypothetical protein
MLFLVLLHEFTGIFQEIAAVPLVVLRAISLPSYQVFFDSLPAIPPLSMSHESLSPVRLPFIRTIVGFDCVWVVRYGASIGIKAWVWLQLGHGDDGCTLHCAGSSDLYVKRPIRSSTLNGLHCCRENFRLGLPGKVYP